MKKRLLSMLLVLVMVIGLLPTAAMAAVSPEVSTMTTTGYYQDAEWVAGVQTPQPELPEGIVAVNKTAEPVEGSTNVYNITLTVETKTSQTTIDADAATTLVLDVSGSMKEDIQVGDGKNDLALLDTVYGAGEGIYKMRIADHFGVVRTYDLRFYNGAWQYDKIIGGWTNLIGSGYEDNAKAIYITRINALKIAAKNFVDSYRDQTADRWLSIVKFATSASEQLAWTNVSTESGANAAKAAIDRLSANGGTNLDDGLRQASAKMDESTVRSIPAKNKYVIALSDGEPTYYINEEGNVAGDGGYMDRATEAATIKTATALKDSNKINKLYTICFDGGNTATEILQKVASTPGDAYTAKNASDLSFIIDKLGETINSGTTGEGLVVTDPMAEYVTVTGTLPEGFVKGTGDTYTWTLANAQQLGTHYLYTITYQIVVDADDPDFVEDQFYPTNGPTYLTYGEETVYFPVPGVKGVKTDYTVVYDLHGGVSTTTGAVDGKYTYTGLHNGDTTPVIAEPTKAGYNFVKWTPTVSDKVNGDGAVDGIITYTAVWELIPTYTLTYDENGGVGGPDDVNGLTARNGYTLATAPVPTHAKTADDVPVVFIGWTAAKDTKIYTKDDTAPTCITTVDIAGNTTVYAVYGLDTNNNGTADVLEDKYTVTYQYTNTVADAPAVPAQVTGVLAGTAVNVAAVPTLAGYTFDGWKKGDVKVTTFTMPAENVTLTGTWELIPVSGLSVTKDVYAINNKLVDANKSYTVNVNDVVTWKITVSNDGNVALRSVSMEDTVTIGKTSIALKLYDADGNQVTSVDLAAKGEDGAVKVLYASYKVTAKDQGYKLANTVVADAGDNGPKDSDTNDDFKVKDAVIHVPVLNKKDHVAYIIGYEDNTVRPENNITRAEVATIFFRLLTDDSRARFWSQTNDFSDVSANDWFNNAVSTMANAGVLTGYPDGTFKPNAPITRAEFAAIAARFSDVTYNGKCSFTDVAATYWAADEIALAEHLGWITGYPDDTFRPGRNITRAEAMTLINRVLERAVEEEHMLKNMVKWIDNSPSAWYYEAVQEATNSHTYTRLSKKVPGQSFYYEDWVAILENPDWAALERAWSKAKDQ